MIDAEALPWVRTSGFEGRAGIGGAQVENRREKDAPAAGAFPPGLMQRRRYLSGPAGPAAFDCPARLPLSAMTLPVSKSGHLAADRS